MNRSQHWNHSPSNLIDRTIFQQESLAVYGNRMVCLYMYIYCFFLNKSDDNDRQPVLATCADNIFPVYCEKSVHNNYNQLGNSQN